MGKIGAITCGAQGAFVYDPKGFFHVPAAPIQGAVIDPNGAGDAFAGGLLYGLIQDMPLVKAGTLGTQCAATILSTLGARVPNNLRTLIGPEPSKSA
jgi:sugar/nucleoside kinase (ribokinase family)